MKKKFIILDLVFIFFLHWKNIFVLGDLLQEILAKENAKKNFVNAEKNFVNAEKIVGEILAKENA